MLLYLLCTTPTQTKHRFPLNKFIYKISSLYRPTFWYICFFYDRLFCQNLIPYLFSTSTSIRSFTDHKLICDNSHRIIVYTKRMVLTAHNLRCHIPRSTTCVCIILRSHLFSNPKISNPNISFNRILNIPLESKTRFSGLISLCIIFLACKYSKPEKIHAIKKRV
jgi:hypothetical protein